MSRGPFPRPALPARALSAARRLAATLSALPLLFLLPAAADPAAFPGAYHRHLDIRLSASSVTEGGNVAVTVGCTVPHPAATCAMPFPYDHQYSSAYVDLSISAAGGIVLSSRRIDFSGDIGPDGVMSVRPAAGAARITINTADDDAANGDRTVTVSGSAPYSADHYGDRDGAGRYSYFYLTDASAPRVAPATLTVLDDETPAAPPPADAAADGAEPGGRGVVSDQGAGTELMREYHLNDF